MSRPAAIAALLLGLAAVAPAGAVDLRYVPGTEDVPLMPGLVAAEDGAVIFDKPEGRIVEVEARGEVARRAVTSFYAQSLPQLGWTPSGPHRFVRDGERLSLAFDGRDGNLMVGFTLAPQ